MTKKIFGLLLLIIAVQTLAQTPPKPTNNISLPSKPDALLPEGVVISAEDGMKAINFRWQPVSPKPKDPITYHLKVWQLMVGQNEADAIRMNRKLALKDVVDQRQVVVEGLVKIPCPNGCRFVWNVQALNRQGKAVGPNNGFSTNATFGVAAPKMDDKK
jgi:hypothetical protein